ncbi:HlyD family efflux transporter periplasmic adaptor subunit [Halomonas urumqiensis]|uniref:Uncharacterized protein n=1 Tax=Halomonas urumqiensis TaxID=1684789 RepID=A0A2N7UCX7_9GAMM|nr:HlyD family efflux transporter periplasmic adaptor subunit [Halomonas urumqiensis]PMR78280.1 hypothetical protein C1H70_16080 [Halomonas urumqiensis]PTB03427.1 hypothetical protein C6V82_02715 [Halomonas urumqiensis]GHE20394.1 hypothetical protein GCM10017767_09150 [Halomonas urumqiensis]
MNSINPPHQVRVTEHWADLASAQRFADLRSPWLAIMAMRIGPVSEALLFDRVDDAEYRVTATYPPTAGPECSELEALAREAVYERRGLVSIPHEGGDNADEQSAGCHLAYPIMLGDFVHGAVAVALATDQQERINEAMRHLQWSLAWLRDFLQQKVIGTSGTGPAAMALEGIADMVGPKNFSEAAQTLALRLVTRFDLERVAIGFIKHGAVRIEAISNSASFGKRMTLVRLIEQAMDEAVDQERAILHPSPAIEDGDAISRAHQALRDETQCTALLTLPLMDDGNIVGAILCESVKEHGFAQRDIDALNAISAFAGPILTLRADQSRPLLSRLVRSLRRGTALLVGPRHLKAKLVLSLLVAAAVAVSVIETDYAITADASVDAAVRRAVVAPFDGFVLEALARAGDEVSSGDKVAALDDREHALEALFWQSERQQKLLEYDRAMGERDSGLLNVIRAQIEQADVRLGMIRSELEQAQLLAPIDGMIVSGDLSNSIGDAVTRGDVLFEIAPLEAYRLTLDVDESQIDQVEPGMTGRFLSSSLPGAPFEFSVAQITPIALPREGRTVFRVEADITGDAGNLRPGMKGIGKIAAFDAPLIWVWTRAFRDWWRMTLWSWLP